MGKLITRVCSGLALLGLATSASAECAWVLWTAVSLPNQRDLVSYARGAAYISAQQCMKALDAEAGRWQGLISATETADVSEEGRANRTD